MKVILKCMGSKYLDYKSLTVDLSSYLSLVVREEKNLLMSFNGTKIKLGIFRPQRSNPNPAPILIMGHKLKENPFFKRLLCLKLTPYFK